MIRVIAATADSELADRLGKAMEGLASVIRCEPDAPSLREMLLRVQADMVVADIESPAFSPLGNELRGAVRAAMPSTVQIVREIDAQLLLIAIGDDTHAQGVLATIRHGARDFIDRESSIEQLRTLLTAHLGVASRRGAVDTGRLTCILGDDSMAGLSFFATSYAVARADQGIDTLLIDCTLPSTEAGAALDLAFTYTVRDAIQDLSRMDRTLLASTLSQHSESGLHVLPLALAAEDVGDLTPRAILAMLTALRGLFSEVIINVGGIRHAGILTELMESSTDLFLVATQKLTSLRFCKQQLLQLAPSAPVMARITLVVDDYHDAITLTEAQIAGALGFARSARVPSARAALVNALNWGKPLVLAQRRHAYARAIRRLAIPAKAMPAVRTPRRWPMQLFGRVLHHAT